MSWRNSGFRFAVCTNKLEWLSKLLLDKLGLTPRFAAICGADTFGVSKPDPIILRETVARAGGDAVADHHGRRCRARCRRGAAGRRPRDRGEFGYTDVPDRGTQAGPADRPHEATCRRP